MQEDVLETSDLTIRFGGHVAVDRVSCVFRRGEVTAIVGPNGAGKTTYFNLISGQLPATSGKVLLRGEEITHLSASARTKRGIGRAFQLTNLFPRLTVHENVRLAVQAREGDGMDLLVRATRKRHLADEAWEILAKVNLAEVALEPVTALPHGDQRKLEVAMLIALRPDAFMFDEPTAGMSIDEAPVVLELIAALKHEARHTILLVEHKMDVIRSLADRIIVLHNGELVADGLPAEVMALDIVREAYLGQAVI